MQRIQFKLQPITLQQLPTIEMSDCPYIQVPHIQLGHQKAPSILLYILSTTTKRLWRDNLLQVDYEHISYLMNLLGFTSQTLHLYG